MQPLKIAIIAGEPSGDQLGGGLMRALKQETTVDFVGVGGRAMAAEGLQSWFPMAELSLAGLVEIIGHIPNIRRRLKETEAQIIANKPDIIITIDAPGFCFRLAKALAERKRHGELSAKLVHYVAPTVWAWKPGRAKHVAQFLDHLLLLFPFEAPYFKPHGLTTSFVGHPVIEAAKKGDTARFFDRHPELVGKKIALILPGSRRSEVEKLFALMRCSWDALPTEVTANWRVVIPTVETVADLVRAEADYWAVPNLVVDTTGKWDAFHAADVALAASGTVALELAAAGVATLITYRVNSLTATIVRRLIKIDYASLINIQSSAMVQPEFLQENATVEAIAPALEQLLTDQVGRDAQLTKAKAALEAFRGPGPTADQAAARAVLAQVEAQ